MNDFLNGYFGFNKQQRNGLLILALISFALLLVRIIYPYFITPDNIIVKNLPLIERKLDSANKNSQTQFSNNFEEKNTTVNYFVFDPNVVSLEELLQLGFKEKTAQTFLKFRSRGFIFKQKEDLKKVYGISDKFYSKLEPYILIEAKKEITQKEQDVKIIAETKAKTVSKEKIEINAVDSLLLLELNGIGPAFAKRILKYRNILGGYVAIEQLKEVYGFNDELYDKIKNNVTVNTALIKKIDINKDDFKSINKHPYLSYELTKTIFDWRKKTVITATNLKEIINDDAVYKKLLPYLQF